MAKAQSSLKTTAFLVMVFVLQGLPAVHGAPIIADHTVVDQVATIPQQYIDEVKKMWLNLPGESHSRGYRYALVLLEQLDPRFAVNVGWSGAPEGPTDQYLRINGAIYDPQFNNWHTGAGEYRYWTTQWAVDYIKTHISHCNVDLNNPIAAVGFGWCWDTTAPGLDGSPDPVYGCRWGGRSYYWNGTDVNSDYGAWGLDAEDAALLGGPRVSCQTYIDAVDDIAAQDPRTVSLFTTGPVDGGGNTGELGYQRWLKHERIRDHVRNSADKVLFDYADILCWNDAGERNEVTWDGHIFQAIHADNAGEYDGGSGGCHIGRTGCLRLGKAIWWMLARLAGWDGVTAENAPKPIPDGTGSSSPVMVSKAAPDGSLLTVSWDAQCSPANVNIIYGALSTIGNYAVAGSKCAIANPDQWAIGDSNIWFLLVTDEGEGVESSWGRSSGGERNGSTASNTCGNPIKNPSGRCP